MFGYIIKKVFSCIFIVFIVSVFAFALIHVLPGDPARLSLGEEASQEAVDALRAEMNLDKPYVVQYILWAKGIMEGDWGESIRYKRPIEDVISERLQKTLILGIPALLLASLCGIVFGILSAMKKGSPLDQIITFTSTVGLGTPVFWIAILLIYVFSVKLRLLPIQGYTSPTEDFGAFLQKAILPIISMAVALVAAVARQTRSNMLEIINQEYIRTSKANGISGGTVVYKYALKNALIPVITIIGLQVRNVIGGAVVVEQVFNIPGLGSMMTAAVTNRDYLLIQAGVLVISVITVGCNLIVDILYGCIDPRIRKDWR